MWQIELKIQNIYYIAQKKENEITKSNQYFEEIFKFRKHEIMCYDKLVPRR